MFIHLADTSAERGQYNLLVEERYISSLLSFAYAPACSQYFEGYWEGLVKIHLAGHWFDKKGKAIYALHDSHLATYASEKEVFEKISAIADIRPRVIIDSGAFSVFTKGDVINPLDYGRWAIAFQEKWKDKMQFLRFMNLDVIGDQEASWKNQLILENLGVSPIPIITHGADISHLKRAITEYDYFALGGLVPFARQKKKLQTWLDHCFRVIIDDYKQHGVMKKVHLLGITSSWVLKRYPCYSSDSSSWLACLRFGDGKAAGLPEKLPRYKIGDASRAATMHTLRSEIKKYKSLEKDATNLWSSRGIRWDE